MTYLPPTIGSPWSGVLAVCVLWLGCGLGQPLLAADESLVAVPPPAAEESEGHEPRFEPIFGPRPERNGPIAKGALKKRSELTQQPLASAPICLAPRYPRQRLGKEQRRELREEIRSLWLASRGQRSGHYNEPRHASDFGGELRPPQWLVPSRRPFLPPLTADERYNFKVDLERVRSQRHE